MILGFVSKADYKVIAKAIRNRVTAIKQERDKKRLRLEEAMNNLKAAVNKKAIERAAEQSELSNQKAASVLNASASGRVASQVSLKLSLWKKKRYFYYQMFYLA